MKKKDIAVLVIIAAIAAVISSIAANSIFNSSKQRKLKVPVVQKIDGTLPQVDNDPIYQAFFNDKALNPTQLIQIGESQNSAPFNIGSP